ncbi:MAG: hypothetical protein AAF974_05725 [Cyanobacteria bacterium P01_E01_bin.34]
MESLAAEGVTADSLTVDECSTGGTCGHETGANIDSDATTELALSLWYWPRLESSYFS